MRIPLRRVVIDPTSVQPRGWCGATGDRGAPSGMPGLPGKERAMKKFLIALLLLAPAVAQPSASRLHSAVRNQFGNAYRYYTLVPYKDTAFAATADVSADTRNSTGRATHWAVYEYVRGGWSFVFAFTSTVDADEESARLDRLFKSHRFSSDMRGKLMYGNELRF